MVLEVSVEDYLVEQTEAHGGFCPKFTSPGMKGAPDRLVLIPGHPTYFIELKRPLGGRFETGQERYHKKIRAAGQRVWVLRTLEEVDAFFIEIGV